MPDERPLSLAELIVLKLSPPEMMELAAHCGNSHIGLRPIAATPCEVHFPLLTDAALRRETSARMDDLSVGVLDIEILRLTPDTNVADFEAVLAFGAACSARFALLAGNDPDPVRTADTLGAVAELARSCQTTPDMEFMPWTCVPHLSGGRETVATCGSDNAGILVDAYHLNRSGGCVDNVPQDDPRFGYVQLCDIAGPVPSNMHDILHEARAERLFSGEGDCDLAGLLRRSPAGIPISREIPRDTLRAQGISAEERACRALEAIRRLLETGTTRPVS